MKKVKEYWEKVKKELGILILIMDIFFLDVDFFKKIVEFV